MHSSPEPWGVREPSPSSARLKMVGNMIEFISPTAIKAQPAAGPWMDAAISASNPAPVAAPASTLPGDTQRRTKPPMKRPTIAPPQ